MKRTVGILAGVAALGVAVYVGDRLWAQNPAGQAAQPLRTRIALVNISKVIKDYKKFSAFREEFKTQYKVFEDKAQAIQKAVEAINAELQKPATDPARREQLEKDKKNYTRQIQDIGEDAKQRLGKQESDQLVIIYKEVQEAAQFYARAKDIELVLQYNDVLDGTQDQYLPLAVQRKLTSDGCLPLYVSPGMDITDAVKQMLNDRYTRMTAPPAGGVQPASATAPKQ